MDLNTSSISKREVNVPVGHIIASKKWKNSDICRLLQGRVQVLYEDDVGVVDFYLSRVLGVIFLTEAELITFMTYKRKLAKLRKENRIQIIILIEKTQTSSQYFPEAQKFCLMELGFSIIPVPSQNEAASILSQMVMNESRIHTNVFMKKKTHHIDETILATVQTIPKLGVVKAKALLEHFESIERICKATTVELSAVIGKASTEHVRSFFGDVS